MNCETFSSVNINIHLSARVSAHHKKMCFFVFKTVETLENERDRLQQIIKSLEEKIKLLEVKISEISLTDNKVKYSLVHFLVFIET